MACQLRLVCLAAGGAVAGDDGLTCALANGGLGAPAEATDSDEYSQTFVLGGGFDTPGKVTEGDEHSQVLVLEGGFGIPDSHWK